jgi:hypothetical protein
MVAALESVKADSALYEVNSGRTPKPADVVAGVAGLDAAMVWVPSAKRLTNLATLELELALLPKHEESRRSEVLADAERHFVEGLALNPVDGPAWYRFAVVRSLRQAPPRAIAECLMQSLDMAPNMRGLWLPRARLLMANWEGLEPDEVAAVQRQLRTIWAADPAMRRPLAQTAREIGRLAVLQQTLGNDPGIQAGFIKIVISLLK